MQSLRRTMSSHSLTRSLTPKEHATERVAPPRVTVTFADPNCAARAAPQGAETTFSLRGQQVSVVPKSAKKDARNSDRINVQDNILMLRWGIGRRDADRVGIVFYQEYNCQRAVLRRVREKIDRK